MKNFNKILQIILFVILILVPIILMIPLYFNTGLFTGTKGFLQYIDYISIYAIIINIILFFIYIKNIVYSKSQTVNIKNLLYILLVQLAVSIIFFISIMGVGVFSMDLLFIIYPIAGIELANIFGLGGVLTFVSFGWILVLFIKYVNSYLILKIFNFKNKYLYYLIAILYAISSSISGLLMMNIFLYAT